VTCDSDSHVDKFADLKDIKKALEVHPLTAGKPYYLGLFLVGAYQEVMGSYHNLFGQPDEAQVVMGEGGSYHVTKVVTGSRVGDMEVSPTYDPTGVTAILAANLAFEFLSLLALRG
jgi:arginine decarboxylase